MCCGKLCLWRSEGGEFQESNSESRLLDRECLDLIVVVLLFFPPGVRKYLTFVFFYFNGNSEL